MADVESTTSRYLQDGPTPNEKAQLNYIFVFFLYKPFLEKKSHSANRRSFYRQALYGYKYGCHTRLRFSRPDCTYCGGEDGKLEYAVTVCDRQLFGDIFFPFRITKVEFVETSAEEDLRKILGHRVTGRRRWTRRAVNILQFHIVSRKKSMRFFVYVFRHIVSSAV